MIVIHGFKLGGNSEFLLLPSQIYKWNYYLHTNKLLVGVEEPFNSEELVEIKDKPSARFARCGRKINILGFRVNEPSLDGELK